MLKKCKDRYNRDYIVMKSTSLIFSNMKTQLLQKNTIIVKNINIEALLSQNTVTSVFSFKRIFSAAVCSFKE